MSQHMEALEKANTVRLERAQIKRDIRDGKCTVIDVLEGKPFVCDTMTVMELLCSQRRWAAKRTRKFLHTITPYLNENRQLKCLTPRERNVLVRKLEQ